LEFVRSGLKSYFSHKLTRGQNSRPVLLVAPAVEERLRSSWSALDPSAAAPLAVAEEQALLDQIWRNVAGLDGSFPSILLAPSARYPMRQILRAELPELPVIAYTQLSPAVSIQPLARVGLD
jgi:type III secretory pathway component EscV